MKIKKLEYYDEEYHWKLSPVEFLPNLNLLVGVSGVGKTRILSSIRSLKAIANGKSLNGVRWNICFSGDDQLEYHWQGQFETKTKTVPIETDSETEDEAKIIHESLVCNDNTLVNRTSEAIIFNNNKTPKLSPDESVVNLLKQEDSIMPVKESLDKIILVDNEINSEAIWHLPMAILKKQEQSSLLSLKESDLPIFIKLAIVYRIFPEEFEKIKKTFREIFPNVVDVKVANLKDSDTDRMPMGLSQLLKEATTLSIKEKGVENWIDSISSGMFKTLMYISQLYLSPDHSIILIDEFENSLGVNCMDSMTDLILGNEKLQFILTSHHPYIINNISPAYWKIVTRQGSLVTVKNAEDFQISPARQKAFIDLINILKDEETLED